MRTHIETFGRVPILEYLRKIFYLFYLILTILERIVSFYYYYYHHYCCCHSELKKTTSAFLRSLTLTLPCLISTPLSPSFAPFPWTICLDHVAKYSLKVCWFHFQVIIIPKILNLLPDKEVFWSAVECAQQFKST